MTGKRFFQNVLFLFFPTFLLLSKNFYAKKKAGTDIHKITKQHIYELYITFSTSSKTRNKLFPIKALMSDSPHPRSMSSAIR